MRRAQISGTIIMYIMTGVVIVAVLAFGVNQLINLSATSGKVACAQFQQSFKERLTTDRAYGSVDRSGIPVDCPLSQVCFIDLTQSSVPSPSLSPLITSSWNAGVQDNVFLIGDDGLVAGTFYVDGLRGKTGNSPYACVPVGNGGVLQAVIYGQGKYVTVENS